MVFMLLKNLRQSLLEILKKALTRGEGIEGEDDTENVKTIKYVPLSIPFKDEIEIRGEIFFDNINTIHLELFLRKVHRMIITIDMKSDLAFIAINNSPCSIQEGSTKDNRHVVILGHLKYNKLSQNSTVSNNNGHILTDTDRYGDTSPTYL